MHRFGLGLPAGQNLPDPHRNWVAVVDPFAQKYPALHAPLHVGKVWEGRLPKNPSEQNTRSDPAAQ